MIIAPLYVLINLEDSHWKIAALVLCGLNALVSRPASSITEQIHLEIVFLDTCLKGLIPLMKNLDSNPFRGFVRLSHSLKEVTTQSEESAGKALKTTDGTF